MAESGASEAAEQQVRVRVFVPCAGLGRGGWLRVAQAPVRDAGEGVDTDSVSVLSAGGHSARGAGGARGAL